MASQRKKSFNVLPAVVIAAILLAALIVGLERVSTDTVGASVRAVRATSRPIELPETTEKPTDAPEEPQETEAPVTQPSAVVESISTLPEAQDAPIASPQPTEAPKAEEGFRWVPIAKSANITDKRIAITVDDCFQMDNMKTIIKLAYDNGGKLTFFPIGTNIVRDGMSDILKTCVFNLGWEIENHTYDHARIFRLPESEMAEQIYTQKVALSKALGVNYEQHFFRFMGGDGMYDQRSHNYLDQLGFTAIAYWSFSGSDDPIDRIMSSLKPGQVYLFHTTDSDTEKLRKFIPYAVSQGYKLVTLNELFGLPANTWTDLSTLDTETPQPRPYTVIYREEKEGTYSWAVVRIQEKLLELGYLSRNAKTATEGNAADGVYGPGTTAAVAKFQKDHGLEPTGIADVRTQELLLG